MICLEMSPISKVATTVAIMYTSVADHELSTSAKKNNFFCVRKVNGALHKKRRRTCLKNGMTAEKIIYRAAMVRMPTYDVIVVLALLCTSSLVVTLNKE